MNKTTLFVAVILMSKVLLASTAGEHGAHGDEHIPLDKIGWQAANLGILLIAIFIFIRKSIVETFVNRQKNYLDQAEKTKSALKDAEAALADIKEKLASLEAGETKSIENAKKEAAALSENMIKDAQAAVEKMKKDAEMMISGELIKAKEEINTLIVGKAVQSATDKLSQTKSATPNQEAAFLKQLEQVKP